MNFCELIRKEREKKYQTPADFFRKNKISCSYYHYTKIENGKIPEIALAVEVLRALDIPIKRGIYALIRSEMPDKESRALFSDPEKSEFKGFGDTMSFDESFIVNPSQINLLNSNPIYLELALFMSCNLQKSFNPQEISSVFKTSTEDSKKYLTELKDIGLIYEKDGKFWTKNWIYTPDDDLFTVLKENTLKRALEKHLGQPCSAKWQKTLTVNVNDDLKKTIEEMLDNLSCAIVGLSDSSPDTKPLTVGLFSSWRTFGHD